LKAVLVILLLVMIAKDTAHINDPYIMRGFAQGLCFVVGMAWMFSNANVRLLKKYWPIFGYLFISLVSGVFSPRMDYALLQTASFVAVLFFAIAYFESQSKKTGDSSSLYFNTTIIIYAVVCVISILLIKMNHSIVYSRVGDWSDLNVGVRFRGLYSAAGMMGAASGLLIGFVLFRQGKWWWRWPVLASGLICLALTQSRTFWIATFVTSIIVWWIYKPQTRKILIAVTFVVGTISGSIWVLGVSVDTSGVEDSARVGSLANLTGRVPLWEQALDSFSKSPFIGYGSTMGSYALRDDSRDALFGDDSREGRSLGHETLHNGYLQTILDLGVLGSFFYITIFVTALQRVYRRDKLRMHGAVMYGVLFMAIGNMGESIVYSASVSHSIVFWCVVIFALHRFGSDADEVIRSNGASITDSQVVPVDKSGKLKTRKCELI
jgi:O-antigen ligase